MATVNRSSPVTATGGSAPSIASVERDERGVTVAWSDGARGRYLHFWLRENCPTDGSSLSGQRLLALADIPVDIRPKSVGKHGDTVTLVWPDDHRSTFDGAWLRERSHSSEAKPPPLDIATWDASLDPEDLVVGFASAMEDDDALFDLIGLIVKHGVARVADTPEDALTRLARRMGYLHDTNYGLVLDVKSELKPWFRVLSSDAIPPHTDNAYRYTPTGISLFHCVRQLDGPGGESFYVDGLRLAERLRDVDADAHAFLCHEPLTFHRAIPENAAMRIDAARFRVEAPVFSTNARGQVTGIRYHPRTVAPVVADEAGIERMYRARRALETLSMDPSMRIEFQALEGECTVYDNHRVMHARKGFERATSGVRHFRQCHVDREELHSRWRLLGARLGRPVHEEWITPGVSV